MEMAAETSRPIAQALASLRNRIRDAILSPKPDEPAITLWQFYAVGLLLFGLAGLLTLSNLDTAVTTILKGHRYESEATQQRIQALTDAINRQYAAAENKQATDPSQLASTISARSSSKPSSLRIEACLEGSDDPIRIRLTSDATAVDVDLQLMGGPEGCRVSGAEPVADPARTGKHEQQAGQRAPDRPRDQGNEDGSRQRAEQPNVSVHESHPATPQSVSLKQA